MDVALGHIPNKYASNCRVYVLILVVMDVALGLIDGFIHVDFKCVS